jgi:hypothetical protein
MANMIDSIERVELIQKLIDNGFGILVEALLCNESKTYTKRGRINKSGACRVLKWKTKQLEDAFRECRKILGEDVFNN